MRLQYPLPRTRTTYPEHGFELRSALGVPTPNSVRFAHGYEAQLASLVGSQNSAMNHCAVLFLTLIVVTHYFNLRRLI